MGMQNQVRVNAGIPGERPAGPCFQLRLYFVKKVTHSSAKLEIKARQSPESEGHGQTCKVKAPNLTLHDARPLSQARGGVLSRARSLRFRPAVFLPGGILCLCSKYRCSYLAQ